MPTLIGTGSNQVPTNGDLGTMAFQDSAAISVGIATVSGNVAVSGITTLNANVILGTSGLSANGGFGTAGQLLNSNGSATYWAADRSANAYTNAVAYVDGKSYVNTAQLSSNLANYQTTAGLAANVATLTANSSTFLGTANLSNIQTFITSNASAAYTNAVSYVDGKSFVNTSQLSSNLANYQTTAGLAANVATLTSNNATNLGGVAAASYVNTSGAYTITGMQTYSNGITFSNTITANGSNGTAGQVLTSSGATGNVYWSTVSGGAGGFTNGQSITVNNFTVTGAFTANSSNGFSGQVLTSNGTAVYWSTVTGTGTVTSVATGDGMTGGPITSSGTVSVLANTGIVANGTGLYVNSAYIATLTANNATYLNGQLAEYYTNATNITTGTLPWEQAPINSVNTTGTFTFSGLQTFNGNSSALSSIFVNAAETTTVSAIAANGTINYDLTTQSVLYYTTNAAANWTVNFRGSSGTTLNNTLANNQTITAAFLVSQGTTAYFANNTQIDGVNVTPRWQNGVAPTAGNASGIDIYTYTIIKTGTGTFTVLASQTQFK